MHISRLTVSGAWVMGIKCITVFSARATTDSCSHLGSPSIWEEVFWRIPQIRKGSMQQINWGDGKADRQRERTGRRMLQRSRTSGWAFGTKWKIGKATGRHWAGATRGDPKSRWTPGAGAFYRGNTIEMGSILSVNLLEQLWNKWLLAFVAAFPTTVCQSPEPSSHCIATQDVPMCSQWSILHSHCSRTLEFSVRPNDIYDSPFLNIFDLTARCLSAKVPQPCQWWVQTSWKLKQSSHISIPTKPTDESHERQNGCRVINGHSCLVLEAPQRSRSC